MGVRGIGYLLKSITDKIKVKADADLKRQNLTLTQSRVLVYLAGRNEPVTQKDIGTFLKVSHPTVVGIVNRMEQKGFLYSRVDPSDRRNKLIELTEKALKIDQDMQNVISQQEQSMLSSLTDEQIDELEKILLVIYRNLD